MFFFVVKRLRWLARLPGLPHLFDAFLLTETCLFHRGRLAAMETLEKHAARRADVRLGTHRFGGLAFVQGGRERGHLHGNGLVDAHVGNARRLALLAAGRVTPHHVFPRSGWISFRLESVDDVPFALELLFT